MTTPEPSEILTQLRTENARLKTEARRYANIINSSLNPIWNRDCDLNIVYCNLAFSEIAEESTDQVLETGDLELYKGHRELARRALATGEEQTERRHIVVGGKRRFYMIREVPIPGEGVIGYATHLTELEEAQEEIQRHARALRDLLDSSTSAMAIYGRDMRLKFYNFAFIALGKHDEQWLETAPTYGEVLERLREQRKLPEQANFKAFKEAQLRLFTTLIEPQEEFFFLPDGKTLRVVAIPHALGGILFVYEDVTDRLALERSYNTLTAVQRETLDHLQEGIVVFAENGRLTLTNPVFRTLWKLDAEFIATEPHIRDVLEACKPLFIVTDWEGFKQKLLARFSTRQLTDLRLERSDGSVVRVMAVPLPDGATLLSFIDITDSTLVERSLRERAEALEAADRTKSEFLANMSYELRSPLTSISGFAEMLAREYAGTLNDGQRDYVEGIYQSAQHLGALISDIIDLATIEAGYITLDCRPFPVQAAIDAVVTLLGERIRLQDVALSITIAKEAETLIADEVRVKQILINLLGYAVRMTKARGAIHITTTRNAQGAFCLTVSHFGIGMDASGIAHFFDAFRRTGKPANDSTLALNLVKRFVDLHGGHVNATSEAEAGTHITCVFPDQME